MRTLSRKMAAKFFQLGVFCRKDYEAQLLHISALFRARYSIKQTNLGMALINKIS